MVCPGSPDLRRKRRPGRRRAHRFQPTQLETAHAASIEAALALGRGVDWIRFIADSAGNGKGKKGGSTRG
jgi:hypothetical protein